MAEKPLNQNVRSGDARILNIATYRRTVNFGTILSGEVTGVDVRIVGVRSGDVVMGVSLGAFLDNDFRVQGTVTGNDTVRLTASYDGSLTDGVDAPAENANIVIAHMIR